MSCKTFIQHCAVRKVHKNATLPVYATAGAAAADVTCVSWEDDSGIWHESPAVINPGKSLRLDTGLQFEIPKGYELKCHVRSGLGFKHGVRLSNCTGVIDSDYRGNVLIKLHNDSDTAFELDMGTRVMQVQIKAAPQVLFFETDVLTGTVRGEGGFGSTGSAAILTVDQIPSKQH